MRIMCSYMGLSNGFETVSLDIASGLSRLFIAEAKSAVKHRGLPVSYLIYTKLVIRHPALYYVILHSTGG